jgi:hypothetical protein
VQEGLMALKLPDVTTPEALAAHLEVPVRTLKELARKIGAGFVIGRSMFFTESDVRLMMEATRPCQPGSTAAATSGTSPSPLPDDGYAGLLKHRTRQQRSESRPKRKPERGNVVSMDQARR